MWLHFSYDSTSVEIPADKMERCITTLTELASGVNKLTEKELLAVITTLACELTVNNRPQVILAIHNAVWLPTAEYVSKGMSLLTAARSRQARYEITVRREPLGIGLGTSIHMSCIWEGHTFSNTCSSHTFCIINENKKNPFRR